MPKARPVSLYPLDFDTALRALVKVPKEAIDAAIAQDKAQRKKTRMKRAGRRVSK
jgi:hypothetical protein